MGLRILETGSRVEDAEVVGELDVSLLEVEGDGVLLRREVQRIESFRLRLRDRGDVC